MEQNARTKQYLEKNKEERNEQIKMAQQEHLWTENEGLNSF